MVSDYISMLIQYKPVSQLPSTLQKLSMHFYWFSTVQGNRIIVREFNLRLTHWIREVKLNPRLTSYKTNFWVNPSLMY